MVYSSQLSFYDAYGTSILCLQADFTLLLHWSWETQKNTYLVLM